MCSIGAEQLFHAIRASGALSLHRTPLILAISVGLFARRSQYEISHSLSALFEALIRELLQPARRDPFPPSLRYDAQDKYRFLRELAFELADRTGGFGELTPRSRWASRLLVILDVWWGADPSGRP